MTDQLAHRRAVARAYRESGRATLATRRYRTKMRAFLAWLKDQPCMDCGQRFPKECMDFDHRRGTRKLITPAYLVNRALPFVQREVRKCDLVCANCHRIRTEQRRAA